MTGRKLSLSFEWGDSALTGFNFIVQPKTKTGLFSLWFFLILYLLSKKLYYDIQEKTICKEADVDG